MTVRLASTAIACAIFAAASFPALAQPAPSRIVAPAPSRPAGPPPAATTVPADAPSADAARLIEWVIASRDNAGQPFIVIDKVSAELFVFSPATRTFRRTPVLLGIAKGDDSIPGVGDMPLARIPVSARTTPAGRFMAAYGPALDHEDVLWVDEPTAVSLHPVVTGNPREHRVARLQSATPADNRITFGCINVDTKFYTEFIRPLFQASGGVVYVLPETRPLREVFADLPPDDPKAPRLAALPVR